MSEGGDTDMPTAEQYKAPLHRDFQEVVTKGNLEAILDFVGSNVEQENHFDPRDVTNPGWQKS